MKPFCTPLGEMPQDVAKRLNQDMVEANDRIWTCADGTELDIDSLRARCVTEPRFRDSLPCQDITQIMRAPPVRTAATGREAAVLDEHSREFSTSAM